MMQIARLRLKYGNDHELTDDEKNGENGIWDFIINNHVNWDTTQAKPLYLTQRDVYNDISLIVSSKSTDACSDFILRHLAPFEGIMDMWVFNLMEPRFFPLPKKLPQNLARFTISLNVHPREGPFIIEAISRMKPSKSALITYIAFTYHGHGDMLISLLAEDKTAVEDFVRKYLDPMKGVVRAEIIPIVKSKKLVSSEEWMNHCRQYFVTIDDEVQMDLKIYEDWFMAGFE
jgi:hypothetical protein